MHRFPFFLLLAFPLLGLSQPLPNAHAHNDYEHKRPLFEALDNGFTSVEADIWLIDGELYVSHYKPRRKKAARTLRNLYLKPLQNHIAANGGRVYPGYSDYFYLMIDFKTRGDSTWQVLKKQLREFESILSQASGHTEEHNKPVKIFISGNRPVEQILAEDDKIAALDGRPQELGKGIPSAAMPVVSDNYSKFLTWKGNGPVPTEELQQLRRFIASAHAEGKKVRLWATPDTPTLWDFLADEGVDLINTDKLPELNQFLLNRMKAEGK